MPHAKDGTDAAQTRNYSRSGVQKRVLGMHPSQSNNDLQESLSRLSVQDADRRVKDETLEASPHGHYIHHTQSFTSVGLQGQQQRMEQGRLDYEGMVASHETEQESYQSQSPDEEHPEERIRGEPQACLFVASLAASKTDAQLMESVTEHFKKWGPLLNVKVLKDWMQRPYSFVQFERVEDARRAMVEAQNSVIDGRHIRIEQARVNRTLLILRLGRTTTEQDIIDVLEQYGPLEDVSVFHDLGPVRNKRYAFAKFCYRDDAINAFMGLRNDSKWTIEWAPNLTKENQIERESVFVGQLNPDLVTEAVLRDRFEEYGNIENIHLVKRTKPGTNQSSAFAFIDFDDEQSARAAIDNENNTSFLGTTIRVQYRESGEYRQQRQTVAMQATRGLVGVPPPVNAMSPLPQYGGAYSPYREPGVGRPMCYAPYYPFPPPGMPMMSPGYVPRPKPGLMYAHSSGGSRGSATVLDGGQVPYQGMSTYNNQAQQTSTPDQYGPPQSPGTAQYGYDYAPYMQPVEGVYYQPAVPAPVYMYEPGLPLPGRALGPPVGSPGPPSSHSFPNTPNPMWYVTPRPPVGVPKRSSVDLAKPATQHGTSPQGRSSEEDSPSPAQTSEAWNLRNAQRKSPL
ncbi:hypothetical protein BGZ75_009543 [Mortierella antarctica]|nr:hypothetical protein BGZ75_009543 [Mortierella antarctica]